MFWLLRYVIIGLGIRKPHSIPCHACIHIANTNMMYWIYRQTGTRFINSIPCRKSVFTIEPTTHTKKKKKLHIYTTTATMKEWEGNNTGKKEVRITTIQMLTGQQVCGMGYVNDTWKWFNDVFCSLNYFGRKSMVRAMWG